MTTTELTATDAAIIEVSGELRGWAIVLSESEDETVRTLAERLDELSRKLFDTV